MANDKQFGEMQVAPGVTIHWSQTDLKHTEGSDTNKATLTLTISHIPSDQVQQILWGTKTVVSGSIPFELSPSNELSDSDESEVLELQDSSEFGEDESEVIELEDSSESVETAIVDKSGNGAGKFNFLNFFARLLM